MSAPIPRPQLLDPDRETSDDREDMTLLEHRGRAQRLDAALHETCEYAQQLWADVARARQYLLDSLPPDPDEPATGQHGASPTGPDDEAGWQRWQDAYSELTSVLAGPLGDSGLGQAEARSAAARRRVVTGPEPVVAKVAAPSGGSVEAAQADGDAATGSPAGTPTDAVDTDAADTPTFLRLARPLAFGVVGALALRGLRPIRRPRS